MNPQTIARVFGVLYLITFITSIVAYFIFYAPVLDDPRYIVGAGADTGVQWGAFLEMILIIANIGTAVVVFPILRRQNEVLGTVKDQLPVLFASGRPSRSSSWSV